MNGLDPESVQATESVERETRTDNDKRIDILIECADFVVCIENKIWSGLHNNLGEYRKYCEVDLTRFGELLRDVATFTVVGDSRGKKTSIEGRSLGHPRSVGLDFRTDDPRKLEVNLVAMTTVPHGRLGGRRRATFESVGAQVPKAEWRGSVLYCLFQEFEDGRAHLVLGLGRVPFLKTERPGVVLFCH